MGGWLRHRPGSVGLRSERPGITGAMGPSMSWDPWPRPVARAAVGMQECTQIGENGLSAPFRALVYTVAPLRADVGTQRCTQIGENGLSAQPPLACRVRSLVRPIRKVRFSVTSPAQSAPFGYVAVASPVQSAVFRESETPECAFP